MSLQLNLEKSAKTLILSLEKAGVTKPPMLEVGFGLDVSGSFDDEHRDGITDRLLTRLVPWGLAFDPDKKLDVFTFSNGAEHVQDVGPVDANNCQGFVQSRIIDRVAGYGYGTDYSYLLESFLKHFGWAGDQVKKAGFFGSLMGKRDQVIAAEKKRSLVIVATDGDNNDHERTRKVLRESQARKDQVYFLFLGISNQGSSFPFLDSIGDEFDNTGFVAITDLRKFLMMTDEQLNETLIGDELVTWLKS